MGVLGGLAVLVVVLAIGGVAFGDTGASDAVRIVPARATLTPDQVDASPAPPSPQELRETTAVATTDRLPDFKRKYGDPPDATLGRMRIPSVGVDAPLGARVVGADGELALPSGPSDVVWYDFSEWPAYGGAPGSGGNAVFAGHVDYAARVPYAGATYRGLGVFSTLSLLPVGELIEIETGGRTLRYSVTWRRTVSAAGGNWSEIMGSEVGADSVTLITCAGTFDSSTLEYSDRVVIRATRLR